MPEPAPRICPAPQRAVWSGGSIAVPTTARADLDAMLRGGPPPKWVAESAEPALEPEGYRVRIDAEDPVQLACSSSAGRRHAAATLLQCLDGNRLPTGQIDDAPTIATRGVMLDISRDRIPTMQELHEIVRTLALLKINHLQLYAEHTIAYPGHERVWSGWSPMTLEELGRLRGWCDAYGIELAGNQNCFGHLSEWLRTPGYEHLAETHGPYDFYGLTRDGPFSLCPIDPRSLDLVRSLIEMQTDAIRPRLFNIGCDETADVGSGRSAEAVRARGKAAIYGERVGAIARAALDAGTRPMLWGDVALAEPAVLKMLPKDTVAIAWGYESDSPFDTWCRTIREAGLETWVSPGTSAWRSFAGRTTERSANIRNAVEAAIDHACGGVLITDWGDLGHRQQWPVAMLAIAEGALVAWNASAKFDPEAAALCTLGCAPIGPWLDALGDADLPLRERHGFPDATGTRGRLLNAGAVFTDMHPARPDWGTPGTVDEWLGVSGTIDDLARTRPTTGNPLLDDECALTAELMSVGAARAVLRRGGPGREDDVHQRIEAIVETHERLWLARSRRGGLDRSSRWYRDLVHTPARNR